MSSLYITKNGVAKTCIYIKKGCAQPIITAAKGGHLHTPTIKWLSKNKINTKVLPFKEEFRSYAIKPHGIIDLRFNNIDDLLQTKPNYFMTDIDGVSPKKAHYESFFNYYNLDAAREVAARIVSAKQTGALEYDTLSFIMPDSLYYKMIENGKELSSLPYTTPDNIVVTPDDPAYRSTVYFTFINEIAKNVSKYYPNFELCTFAYMYAEKCPKVRIHNNVTIWLAWIDANDHFAYEEDNSEYANVLKQNFINWSKCAKSIAVYNYWGSLNINNYSRPISKVAQKNLQLYKRLGFKGVLPEAVLDYEKSPMSQNVYEMNELYYWQMTRLFWNCNENLDKQTVKFCRLAYGKAARYMQKYYKLIQEGWDNSQGLVRYSTGGEVYILQFIIEMGLAKRVLSCLQKAYEKASLQMQKTRILNILITMQKQIEIFNKVKKEDCFAKFTNIGSEQVLSNYHMDYRTNVDSVWNTAKSLVVLKNYENMQDYPQEADFEAKVLWDEKYLYIGFSVKDDKIVMVEDKPNSMGSLICKRDDGTVIEIYVEMYICGNELNRSTYYGYFSGFFKDRGVEYYINSGAPKQESVPKDFIAKDFVKLSSDPALRYYFHVQAISFLDLGVESKDALPCGSFVYYNNRYGRAGWKGNGLWAKERMARFELIKDSMPADKVQNLKK